MVRSLPNTMQVDVSVSMLLEGVPVSFFQRFYSHTQVFFEGFNLSSMKEQLATNS